MRRFFQSLTAPVGRFSLTMLERATLGLMLILIVLSFALANLQALVWIGSEWVVATILPSVIIDLTNEERSEDTLPSLTRNPLLDRAATLKAEHTATHEYFAHHSPDGVSPWYWFAEVGYTYLHAGENLAVHFTDSGEVVKAWMGSPLHRDNILHGDYTEIGVGAAQGTYNGYPTVYVVQLFGTPQGGEGFPESTAGAPSSGSTPTGHTEALATETTSFVAAQSVLSSEAGPGEEIYSDDSALVRTPLNEGSASAETAPESLYSDLATTSAVAQAERIGPHELQESVQTGFMARLATQPGFVLQTLYVFITGLVLLALLATIGIEAKRRHPVQVIYACILLLVMAALFKFHLILTSGVTIV